MGEANGVILGVFLSRTTKEITPMGLINLSCRTTRRILERTSSVPIRIGIKRVTNGRPWQRWFGADLAGETP